MSGLTDCFNLSFEQYPMMNITKTTNKNVDQKDTLYPTGAPQEGHVLAFVLTWVPHSLHFRKAIVAHFTITYICLTFCFSCGCRLTRRMHRSHRDSQERQLQAVLGIHYMHK